MAALIIAYRRFENLEVLVNQCLKVGFGKIYIALDFAASDAAKDDVDACLRLGRDFEDQFPSLITLKLAKHNLGCALSVLTACDWAFQEEEFVVVLEDDCLPSSDFFSYIADGIREMNRNESIFLVCGTQFAPNSLTKGKWLLSKYPLIWGWATSKTKWALIKSTYLEIGSNNDFAHFPSRNEYRYWKAGTRRALQGFVDAWDTPLVFVVNSLGGLVLLPGENLVRNIGNDNAATHTVESSKWLNRPSISYSPTDNQPEYNSGVDSWLRVKFYRISLRHFLSTKITFILDSLRINKKIKKPLLESWTNFSSHN